jgi:hypothetical protein
MEPIASFLPFPTNGAAEPELELLPPADPPTAVVPRPSLEPSGDDLALAAEVAAAVEVEIDEDPEWALLARGPAAFPVDGAQPDVSPDKQGDEGPEPDGPRDS